MPSFAGIICRTAEGTVHPKSADRLLMPLTRNNTKGRGDAFRRYRELPPAPAFAVAFQFYRPRKIRFLS